jgi:hypothetical protein
VAQNVGPEFKPQYRKKKKKKVKITGHGGAHYNSSIQEAEAGGLGALGQPEHCFKKLLKLYTICY